MTPQERFWAKVAITPGCWLWTASTFRDRMGYGKFQAGTSRATGRVVYAHRYAYELEHGPVPAGFYICHRCDTPACVRPEHLFIGSPTDNNADMARKERHGRSLLTHEQARWARTTSQSAAVVAAALGVRRGVIYDARRGRTYKHT